MFSPGNREEECCGGRCCPYGVSYAGPIIATVIAFFFTLVVPWSCNFFQVEYRNSGISLSDEPVVFNAGPWTVEDFNLTVDGTRTTNENDLCVPWSDHSTLAEDTDGALRFARTILLLVALPAYVLTFIFSFGSCCIFEPNCLKCMSFTFIAFGVLMPFSLVCLASDWCRDANECKIAGAGITTIFMFFLWIIAGASIRSMKEKEKGVNNTGPSNPGNNVEMVTTRITETKEHTLVEEDGTVVKVISTTVNNIDGTKTVTETRQILQIGRGETATAAASTVASSDEEYAVATAKPVFA